MTETMSINTLRKDHKQRTYRRDRITTDKSVVPTIETEGIVRNDASPSHIRNKDPTTNADHDLPRIVGEYNERSYN
jgi:hypothetical protein